MGQERTVPSFKIDRTEALADGVFATVMTILVLSLVVPTVTGSNASTTLEADLYALLPTLFAYIITFVFLGVLWVGHQNVLSHIARMDIKILWVNILLLMAVGLIPFSTALLGKYPLQPSAALVYGINGLAASALYNILWFYPRRQRLTHPEKHPEQLRLRGKISLVGPTVYSLAIAFSFIDVEVSLGLYVFITIFYIIFGGRSAHLES